MHTGAAPWIEISAYDQKINAKAELEELQSQYSQRLQNFQPKRVLLKGLKGLMSGLEMTGLSANRPFVVWGAVFSRMVWRCTCLWNALLQSARMAKGLGAIAPQASVSRMPRTNFSPSVAISPMVEPADPALATLLKKAALLYSERRGLSGAQHFHGWPAGADHRPRRGVRRIARRPQTHAHRRSTARLHRRNAAWSRDGKQLAYAGERGGLVRVTLGRKADEPAPLAAASVAFLPDNRLLVAAGPALDKGNRLRPIGRFTQQRLLRLEEDDDTPKTLLEFPLARFADLAVSPDGKQLALVTNKDHPRGSNRPGHLYVGNPDGTGLRQLTREPELIRSVAWSEDGRFLYVVIALPRR